jgi:hypothetical protein
MTHPIQRVGALDSTITHPITADLSVYNYNFPIPSQSEMVVELNLGGGWVPSTGYDFTVEGIGTEEGGFITFRTDPMTSGIEQVRISRDTLSRMATTVVFSRSNFRSESVNVAFARNTMAFQELYRITNDLNVKIDSEIDALSSSVGPFIRSQDCLLVGDGVSDDEPALNAAIQAAAANGGGWFALKSPIPGGAFRFNSPVLLYSGVTLQFLSPVRIGLEGAFRMQGRLAEDTTPAVVNVAAGVGETSLLVSNAGLLSTGDYVSMSPPNSGRLHEARITGIAGPLITFTPGLSFVTPIGSLIYRRQAELLALDVGLRERQVLTSSTSRLVDGDYVQIEDDTLCLDFGGASTARTNIEHAMVTEVDGALVTLDRRLGRPYAISRNARITKMNPCLGAAVIGALASYAQNSGDDRVDTFEMRYAVDGLFLDCHVLGGGAYGSNAQMFRSWCSYRSRMEACSAELAKYQAPGEGYGFSDYSSTGTRMRDCNSVGNRHGLVVVGATGGDYDVSAYGSTYSPVDTHGCNEVDCRWTGKIDGGGTDADPGTAISIGHEENHAGSHRITIAGSHITGVGVAVEVLTPSSDIIIESNRITGAKHALQMYNNPGLLTQLFGAVTFNDNDIEELSDYIVNVDGYGSGGSTRAIDKLTITNNRIKKGVKGFRVLHADRLVLEDNIVDEYTSGADTYIVRATDILKLSVSSNDLIGIQNGVSMLTCPGAAILENNFIRPTGTNMLDEQGGSAGFKFQGNRFIGVDPNVSFVSAGLAELHPGQAVYPLIDAATIAVDAELGDIFPVTLGGNRAFGAPTHPSPGKRITFRIKQDGTGSRVPTWNAVYRFPGGTAPTLTTTANRTDYVHFMYNSTDSKWDMDRAPQLNFT